MIPSLSVRIRNWGRSRVGVVGDLILDRYTSGRVERVSPEAPVPVLHVGGHELRLGGATNVAWNLLAAGVDPWTIGVVGEDVPGVELRELMRGQGLDDAAVVEDPTRPTVVKQRLVARHQQVLRVDYERVGGLSKEVEGLVVERIQKAPEDVRVWVLSDYGKGAVTPRVIAAVKERAALVLTDPKGSDYGRYEGVSILTPNRSEAEAATRIPLDGPDQWREAAERLIALANLNAAIITLGGEGIYVRTKDGRELHVQTEARSVYDVTGAGDTVIAWLATALASGEDLFDAVRSANLAAGIVVGRLGTATVSRDELARRLEIHHAEDTHKVVDGASIAAVLAPFRARGEGIVFTNGCFDILHEGHVDYLRFARSRGDLLVIGVNDDASIQRLKGPGRPLNPLSARAKVLAALADVDFVVPFSEDTPERLIQTVDPHVLVKGEDWRDKGVVGREWVEARGGLVVLAPLTRDRSTTGLIEKVRNSGLPSEGELK